MFDAFSTNNKLKEINLSNTRFEIDNFNLLLEKISNKPYLETLIIKNIDIKFTKELVNKLNEFLKNSHLKKLDISNNVIESEHIAKLLEAKKIKILHNWKIELTGHLKEIGATEILQELEKDPTTLNITNISFGLGQPVGYLRIPENTLKNLLNILKEDTNIKHLNAYMFSWSLESIKLFVEFLKDNKCSITSISFSSALNNYDTLDFLLESLELNINIKKFNLSNNYFGDMGLSKLIDVLSQRPNTDTEILELRNINISLENKIIIDKFSKFLKNSNVKVLNISSNPIKLEHLTKFLETIQETNVSYLDISSIFFNNDHISALSSFIKNCKLAELYFSLSKEVNKESKKELSSAIQDNKSLINCFIMAANIGLKVQERKELEKQIKDTTEQNKYLLEDVAKFLKDFNEEPNNRIPGDILNHYLKSYLGLNKDCLKEELEKLGVTEVVKVFDNVDDYLSIAGKDAAYIGSLSYILCKLLRKQIKNYCKITT